MDGYEKVLFQIHGRDEHERFINFMNRSTSIIDHSVFRSKQIYVGRLNRITYNIGIRTFDGNVVFDMNSDGAFATFVVPHSQMNDITYCLKQIDGAMKKVWIDY
ncbi:hypothetical protein phiAS5_ORF0222 [Aeromonas phage phiAS5]|uniref:Uncharacterized protein n=1 Tax=Aeromonas phage phiAS5 TaxID=879630 RepID=E1A1X6_9CAUD|nr:hypothetical protein phiAS5_ORF0222 [Aeromonas phage phiAS5]ADM80065.1 hypothetical protein phiAS5_ORF0222 [Aeromonas phage phiAS5]